MTRFGRPGRFKDFFGVALVAAAFVLLGIQTAPAAETPDSVSRGDTVTETVGTEVETTEPSLEANTVRI